jgi:septation ring formation regulator EzrA
MSDLTDELLKEIRALQNEVGQAKDAMRRIADVRALEIRMDSLEARMDSWEARVTTAEEQQRLDHDIVDQLRDLVLEDASNARARLERLEAAIDRIEKGLEWKTPHEAT